MAFNRILDVYVIDVDVDANGVCTAGEAVKVVGKNADTGEQALDADCSIQRSNRARYNTAAIKIYNLPLEMRTKVEQHNRLIRIDAGYEDEGFGTWFYGQIITAFSTPLSTGDFETTIQAMQFRAINMAFESLYVSMQYKSGTNLMKIVSDIGALLGVSVIGLKNADIVTPHGFVHTGQMKLALDYVAKILRPEGKAIFYDLGEIVVYNVGQATSEFEEVYLDNECGLLEAKIESNPAKEERLVVRAKARQERARRRYDKVKSADGRTRIDQSIKAAQLQVDESKRIRVNFKCLFNHRLRPNCLVQISHGTINGDYCLDDATAKLSSWADDFCIEGTASRDG